MPIIDKDFIKLNYTGKIKESGEIFDTTLEDVAEEAGIKAERDYHPMVLAVGTSQFLPKLQEAIKKLEVGDKESVEIAAEDAYGKRNPELIQLVPMKEFKKQNITPYPGMPLTLDGQTAVVRTVNGGRVRVDFNHELAGKDLIFDIEIVEKITDNSEKIKGLIEVYYGNPSLDVEKTEIEIEDGVAKIILDKIAGFEQRQLQEVTLSKFRVAKEIYDNIDEVSKVQFIDEFEEPEPKEETEEVDAEEKAPEVLDDDEN